MITNDDVKQLKTIFATKDDLLKLEIKIESSMEKFHSKIFDLVDGLAKEAVLNREFRAVTTYKLEDLDKRLKASE